MSCRVLELTLRRLVMLSFVQSWVAGATRVQENGQMVDDLEGADQQPKHTIAYSVVGYL